jgi:HlyD family secretion protein
MLVGAMDRPITKRRLPLMAAAVSVAILAVAAWLFLHPAARTLTVDASRVTVSTVTPALFHDFIPLQGEVVPLDSVVLDAVQGGRVEEVFVEPGQRVSAGQKLLRLSDPSLELEAIARETQVIEQINNQQSQQLTYEQTITNDAKAVADAEYNILRLGRQIARRQPLLARGFVSIETLEQATDELNYQMRLKQIAAGAFQRDKVVIARGQELTQQTAARLADNLVAAKKQLDELTVRAPSDGILTGFDVHVGEEKSRGQHLGQVDRDGGFKVTVRLDEFYLTRVKPGQPVTLSIDGKASRLIVAKVYPQVSDRRFEADLTWAGDPPAGLRRGQAVQGKLELEDDAQAMVLPAGPFLQGSGGAWVFVLDADGTTARRRTIRLGRRSAEQVEVLSGLQPGDRVVTSDYTGFDRIDRLSFSP